MDEALLKTKPTHLETIPTNDGWVDPKTNELVVAIKNLKDRLGAVTIKRGRGRPRKVQHG